jgi:tight adherence protein B
MDDLIFRAIISLLCFAAVYVFIVHGWRRVVLLLRQQEKRLDTLLNHQLLMEVPARHAMIGIGAIVTLAGVAGGLASGSSIGFILVAALALLFPQMIFRHLETKRKKRLDEQIVDGITTLASGVRAGLTLVQSMQLLVRNSTGPLKQEFRQLMREFDLGIDLHQAMRNTSDRIGSVYYRLLFSAIQAHRDRGGDMGQSLDRIAESVREIQRLEGRLDAITAQGRAQARFMGIMPFVIIGILWLISPDDTSKLLTEPLGRVLLMIALVMIGVSFMWIRRIMQVDI